MILQQTKLTSKITKILDYRMTHTLAETGKKFKLSAERIRQIGSLSKRERCDIHNRFYYNVCSHCLAENYRMFLWKLDYKSVLKETKIESKDKRRDYLSVWRRIYLVEILLNKFDMSFAQIAELLDKDYSTIAHLVKKIK